MWINHLDLVPGVNDLLGFSDIVTTFRRGG
jgi:hypothetical protein